VTERVNQQYNHTPLAEKLPIHKNELISLSFIFLITSNQFTLAPRLLASSICFLVMAKFSNLFDVAVICTTAIKDGLPPDHQIERRNVDNYTSRINFLH
jgi:hypothetical protein